MLFLNAARLIDDYIFEHSGTADGAVFVKTIPGQFICPVTRDLSGQFQLITLVSGIALL
jgi:hypothetical protein